MKFAIFFFLFGLAVATPLNHLPIAQESREDGFEEAVEVTEVAPGSSQQFEVSPGSSQQLIVEEEVSEGPLPEPLPKFDLSKYMVLIPADQFRNFVTVPVPLPTIPIPVPSIGSSSVSSSVSDSVSSSVSDSVSSSVSSSVSDSVSVSTSVSSSSASPYGHTVRSISGVKGGPTIVRSEMIKGLPPPPAARKTSSSTVILP